MIHVRPFGLQCSEAMSVHARLVKFNPSIPHVQNCLAPVVCEHTDHFEWTDAATAGLEEIKALLVSNPILAAPNVGEPMLLYISATHQVVSAVLVVEREEDGHKFPLQKPVYYISTVLTPCKSR